MDYYLCVMEDQEVVSNDRKHKEGTQAFCQKYVKDCVSINSNVTTNPFNEDDLKKFNTKECCRPWKRSARSLLLEKSSMKSLK